MLDPIFGSGGSALATIASTATAHGMAWLPNGKILVVGEASGDGGGSTDVALAQFNQDGTPDLSFGTGGMRTLDLYGGDDHINAVVL